MSTWAWLPAFFGFCGIFWHLWLGVFLMNDPNFHMPVHGGNPLERLDVGKMDFTTEHGREVLIDALVNSSLCSQPGFMETSPDKLPRRYLPPGNFSDLYRLYTAACHSAQQPAASSATFFRTLRSSGWGKKLRHRGKTTHAKCSTCHKLKNKIKKARTLQEHAHAADLYLRHLGGQFADRKVYWELRHRAAHDKDVIIAIQDSMDKSKFKLPRYPSGVAPKALEQKVRPECELTACLVHGQGIFIYVADPDLSFGSGWSIEVFSRSLQSAWELNQKSGQPWPRICKLFADNTPKEQDHVKTNQNSEVAFLIVIVLQLVARRTWFKYV